MKAYVIIDEMIHDHFLQIRMDLWIRYSLRARDGFIQPNFYKRFDCFSL